METVGLFFGSFNPVHNGHLSIARHLLEAGYCGKIRFVVSPRNPWKEESALLDERKRLQLVELAIAGERGMEVSDFEFSLPRPSYTYRTLQAMREREPEVRFALIIGGDNLKNFHLWRHSADILEHFPILAYPRPGEILPSALASRVTVVRAPLNGISSTEVRRKAAAGEDVSALVPPVVLPWILEYYAGI